MAVCLREKEVAKEEGMSMGKLQRDADIAYNTFKRMFKDLVPPDAKITGNYKETRHRALPERNIGVSSCNATFHRGVHLGSLSLAALR